MKDTAKTSRNKNHKKIEKLKKKITEVYRTGFFFFSAFVSNNYLYHCFLLNYTKQFLVPFKFYFNSKNSSERIIGAK